jgi:hypothetical protein
MPECEHARVGEAARCRARERADAREQHADVEARPRGRGRLAPDRVERDADREAADREREPRRHQHEQHALVSRVAVGPLARCF